jgi:hypothetical protein
VTAKRPKSVSLTHNWDDSIVELVVRGHWSRAVAVEVYEALRKGLAEHPSVVIVDLEGLSDLDGHSASTWIAVSRAALGLNPPARVALCAPPTRQVVARLRRLGCTRYLSLFVSAEQARAAVADNLPLSDRLQLRWLPAQPASAGVVRDAVALACRLWSMETLNETAQDVAVDLVDDSVTHARSAMLFTLCRRSSSLYLALRDHEPTLPPVRNAPPAIRRLPVVTARSYVWGASNTHDGKVVWAIVRARPGSGTDPAPA